MIVSSAITEDRAQIDGRRAITERHTDHAGKTHDVSYLADADTDADALLALHAEQIATNETQREIADMIAFSVTGHSPEEFPFSWVLPSAAFQALMIHCLTADAAELLRFAVVAAQFTVEGLGTKVGIPPEMATAIIGLANEMLGAKDALDAANAMRVGLAQMLGI